MVIETWPDVAPPRLTGVGALRWRELARVARCEGIALAPDGSLWTGSESGVVYRIEPTTGALDEVCSAGTAILGLCHDGDGNAYACANEGGVILRISTSGAVERYSDGASGTPLLSPNWPLMAEDGTLIFSDSGSEEHGYRDGRLIYVGPGGGDGEVADLPLLPCPNGLALAPTGALFVAETLTSRVLVVEGGMLRTFVDLPRMVPDGLALDAAGGLLVACFQPNRIVRVDSSGCDCITVLDDWSGLDVFTPTNVAFFGDELRDLAIASLSGWSIGATTLPWPGQRLHYPRAATLAPGVDKTCSTG